MGDLSEELSGGCYSVKTKPPKTLLPDSSIRQYRGPCLRANGSRKSTHYAVWRSCLWHSSLFWRSLGRCARSGAHQSRPFFGALAYSFLRTNVRLSRWFEYWPLMPGRSIDRFWLVSPVGVSDWLRSSKRSVAASAGILISTTII